jgi:hypothetical protein
VQDEVERRFGQEGIDGRAFGLAQIEVQSTLFVRERGQPVEISDLAGAQNIEATGFRRRHAVRLSG